MDTGRLKRALGDEYYFHAHAFTSVATGAALLVLTPLTLLPCACTAGAVFVGLFAAHLWRPTTILASLLAGLWGVAALGALGAGIALNLGLSWLAGCVPGAGLGAWLAWQLARAQLRDPALPSDG